MQQLILQQGIPPTEAKALQDAPGNKAPAVWPKLVSQTLQALQFSRIVNATTQHNSQGAPFRLHSEKPFRPSARPRVNVRGTGQQGFPCNMPEQPFRLSSIAEGRSIVGFHGYFIPRRGWDGLPRACKSFRLLVVHAGRASGTSPMAYIKSPRFLTV